MSYVVNPDGTIEVITDATGKTNKDRLAAVQENIRNHTQEHRGR